MAALKPLKVLYHLHPNLDTLDFTGPLEILSHATLPGSSTAAFNPTITAVEPTVTSSQKCTFNRHIPLSEAYEHLADYDVLVIPGGGVSDPGGVLEKKVEPLGLVKAFADLPKKEDRSVRTLLSVCTGSLILEEAGVLDGHSATTHPVYYGEFEKICAAKGKTEVLKERFVVNEVDEGKGLRIVTAGGVSSGLDASLWLVKETVGQKIAENVAEIVQHAWRQGVVL
ncbi:Isonitrile hydratase [Lachnellula suecica]|uniref:Isonitrile hydratase n=1 Tax=Lachnellula suecica TaxID=602035 RepID=A0A8T9C9V8_9HELO|nr:Isonitrile hydratase [Lachnellula suecica]